MPEPAVERRLAAVLAADVAGYSRLMGADEEATLAALKDLRSNAIDPAIAVHGGRIVKTTGDGLLAEFPSVLEAVRCAVDFQAAVARTGAERAADRRILLRVGINLGDIILDSGDIFGDGVNVAARLEGLAEPGGIAVSGAVYDQVRTRLDLRFDDLGAQSVKNIAEPVRVYRVSSGGGRRRPGWRAIWRRGAARGRVLALAVTATLAAAAAVWLAQALRPPIASRDVAAASNMHYPLPEKPSIAVLPFAALGGDSRAERIGDGLTESIVSALSKSSKIFVIGRDTVFTYKGKAVTAKRVAEELGVRYVLGGSVQRSGDKLRITAQLTDAMTGYQLWSERYDRGAAQLFALQDGITLNVVTALQVELTEGEMSRVRRRGTNNLQAWLLVNQSIEHFERLTREDNARARALAQEALGLDPKYPDALIRLARTYITDYQAGWVSDRAAAFKRAVELVGQALAIDDTFPDAYNLLGAMYLYIRRHDEALAFAEKAVELDPSYAIAKASLGMVQTYSGQPLKALATLRGAMRLSPYYPDWFLSELGRAYMQTDQNELAIAALKQRLERNPDSDEARILLAAAYGAAGHKAEAEAAMREFLRAHPGYTVGHYAEGEFYRRPQDLERILTALRAAGLPE